MKSATKAEYLCISLPPMVALAGPYFIFATLLVVSGVPKLSNPAATTRALEGLGLPRKRWFGQAVGLVEIFVGIAAISVGGRFPAAAMAVLYLGFAGFILYGLRSSKVSSCGCFGEGDTPPSRLHLGIDVAAAGVATVLVARPIGDITAIMTEVPWAGVPLLILIVIGTWLALMVLTLLPAVFAEAKA